MISSRVVGVVTRSFLAWTLALSAGLSSCSSPPGEPRLLIFSKTTGFRHESIKNGIEAIQAIGQRHHFLVDTTENAELFTEANLKRYRAVVFLNTTGDLLDDDQQNAFERYIQAGGGYLGIHAAADAEYQWPWYNQLVGAWFNGHPSIQKGKFTVVNKNHPATDSLPAQFEHEDEFYNFKSIQPDINVLVQVDERSYQGGELGANHPMSWYHDFQGGRAFYTNMGHVEQTFSEPLFLTHLWGGLRYVMGGDRPKALDYSHVSIPARPDEFHFFKVILDEGLDEPLELAVLEDGRVLFIQRGGAVLLYSPVTKKSKVIAEIPVDHGREDGLIGLTVDPAFESNGWVYLYYSPAGEVAENVLVRVTMKGDTLDWSTKKQLLSVKTQRLQCCHTGGSLAFDKQGNLYLSTGDNTNPFESDGYSPSDERPNRFPWDAQGASGNTNDLRGKILRIHPEPDGSYTIPGGNLFPPGTPKTRPEIYVMGTRNPYRISIDDKSGFLYWGEVGPDAGQDTVTRGPRGHDEINQARKAGFFGWPYFVGNNKAYVKYDFMTRTSKERWDSLKPVNTSPNNTGLTELPPANSAFIWYPYAESPEFPLMGTGGRTAMAGPVYRRESFKGAARPFPDYYDGKLFWFEMSRQMLFAVTMDTAGRFVSMERFMPNTPINSPIEMQFGPDGDLYMIEYGRGEDARLVRIEYHPGNRAPAVVVASDKKVGAAPLTVAFSSTGTRDYDHDPMTYHWVINDQTGGRVASLSDSSATYTFDKPGIYQVQLTVTDSKGAKSTAETRIRAGNEPPEVEVEVAGNKSFFFPGKPIEYTVKVTDREDGVLEGDKIPADRLNVSVDYSTYGYDNFRANQRSRGETRPSAEDLIAENGCQTCHAMQSAATGPGFKEIAAKYQDNGLVPVTLAKRVIAGGSGVWGSRTMSPHPKVTLGDAATMVRYILSVNKVAAKPSLPATASHPATVPPNSGDRGAFVFKASYTDGGSNGLPALTRSAQLVLRSPTLSAAGSDTSLGGAYKDRPSNYSKPLSTFLSTNHLPYEWMVFYAAGASIGYDQIDLTGIERVVVTAGLPAGESHGAVFEIHIDSPTGPVIGATPMIPGGKRDDKSLPILRKAQVKIQPTSGVHDLFFVAKNDQMKPGVGGPLLGLWTVRFEPRAPGAGHGQDVARAER